jgi:hypothetical protein
MASATVTGTQNALGHTVASLINRARKCRFAPHGELASLALMKVLLTRSPCHPLVSVIRYIGKK